MQHLQTTKTTKPTPHAEAKIGNTTTCRTGVFSKVRLTTVCGCVHHVLSGRYVAREDMLARRVHSRTVYSIRERAFLILGELRHRTAQGAAETRGHRAHGRLPSSASLCHCVQERHRFPLAMRVTGYS